MEALDWLRVTLAAHPMAAAAAALLVAAPLASLIAPTDRGPACQRVFATLALVVIAGYAVLVTAYALDDHFFDPAEPTMTAVGWVAAHGDPIYPALDAPERYAHVYGPLAFLVHGAALRIAGPSLLASKALGAIAALAALACVFAALIRSTDRSRALVVVGACALLWLAFRDYTFWTRPEPFLLLLVSAALWIAASVRGATAAMLVGVAAGLAIDFKITGGLYLVPVIVMLGARDGWWSAGIASVTAGVTTLLPFLLPNVSVRHYVDWLALSAGNGLVGATIRQDVEWMGFLLVPLIAIQRSVLRTAKGVALIASMALVVVVAAKPGGGAYHLLPFVPVIAVWVGEAVKGARPGYAARVAVLATCLGTVALAIVQQASFLRVMWERHASDEGGDLRAFLAVNPGVRVQVGYGRDDRWTFVRPLAVFASGAYLVDAPAVQEHQRSGLGVPAATIEAIRTCRVDVWLLPKGDAPFVGPNRYAPSELPALFPPAFIAAFAEAYVRVGATRYFDVWRCATATAP